MSWKHFIPLFCVISIAIYYLLPVISIGELRISEPFDEEAIYNMFDSHELLIKPTRKCPAADGKSIIFLFGIFSSVHNHQQRALVRETWGTEVENYNSKSNYNIVYLFFVGKSGMTLDEKILLDEEVWKFGDIVQMDFYDDYKNLTLKTYSILKYAVSTCPQAHFIFKTDDDCYVNIPKFLGRFGTVDSKLNIVIGQMNINSKVIRNSTHRWYVSKKQYPNPNNTYLPYMNGGGYLMTSSAAFKLYSVCKYSKFIPIEDLWLTGVCGLKAGVQLVHEDDFESESVNVHPCYYLSMILVHPMNLSYFPTNWKPLQYMRKNGSIKCLPRFDVRVEQNKNRKIINYFTMS